MSRVIIKKVAASENPEVPTPTMENYNDGQHNEGVSLPIEYEVEGTLVAPISIGKSIKVIRTRRNDVHTPGLFSTSPVISWDGQVAKTHNSIYHVTQFGN